MKCPNCASAQGHDEGLAAWRVAHQDSAGSALAGWPLVFRASVAFVLPVLGALFGALVAGPGETERFLGLVGGLILASAAAALLVGLADRRGSARRAHTSRP